jgi:Family of unknown function (DUF5336)
MTNTPSHSAYPGYGAYGWYPPPASAPKGQADRVSRSLWTAVAVLGAATFAVSLGAPVALGFPVRLSVLAAIVAAVGLLPGQTGRGWIVVAFAVTGFGDAVTSWIGAGEPRSALTVVMVLTALQSLAAAAALLHESRAFRAAESVAAADYSAYTSLAQMYQAYAAQYLYPPTEQDAATAQAQAGTGARTANAAQESFAALQARYAQHGVGAPAGQSRGSTGAPSVPPVAAPGMPANRGVPESDPYRAHRHNVGDSTVEPTAT